MKLSELLMKNAVTEEATKSAWRKGMSLGRASLQVGPEAQTTYRQRRTENLLGKTRCGCKRKGREGTVWRV